MTHEPPSEKRGVRAVFEEALERTDPAQRSRYLEEVCGSDRRLRREVEELLEVENAPVEFLPCNPQAGESTRETSSQSDRGFSTESPGTSIGRYKLLEKIGEGGFGVVYMAEQEKPVRRKVALKIIKLGMDTRQVIARFEAERQALAMMDHPNIAKVLDAGATETGRPYFVMELVRGITITQFCEENRLTIKERLQLFIPVCQAIQHAHQKGVIHRDIKPSNVLVTMNDGVPHPMVIDFGVAKAIGQRLTEKTLYTRFAQMIGTPAYMSPEQAEMSKQDVDTRTDVYSLGILLYELLTGTTPFPGERLREAGYAEIQRIIGQEEPVRPSTMLGRLNGRSRRVAASRRCEPASLMKLIKGDLDWIVLKAIEKDRNRRYDTTNGLAADLQRYLLDEPVTATPPGKLYRFRKFVHRNRVGVLAGVAVVCTLALGTIVSTVLAVRAIRAERQRSEEARRARLSQYVADINLAGRALAEQDLGKAQELLENHAHPGDREDFRGWEWSYLWEQTRSDASFRLGEHSDAIRCVALSPSGRTLASGDMAGTVKLWDLRSRDPMHSLHEVSTVHSLVFLTEDVLVTANQSGTVTFYEVTSGRALRTIDLGASVRAVAVSPDQGTLACLTGPDGGERLRTWSIGQPTTGDSLPIVTLALNIPGPDRHVEWIHAGALAFSPDSNTLAVGYSDSVIRVYRLEGGLLQQTLEGSDGSIATLAFSSNGRWLASGATGREATVRIWDINSGVSLRSLSGHKRWVSRVAFVKKDAFLLTSSVDQTLRLWDTANWEARHTFKGHTAPIWALAATPSGEVFITGGRDQALLSWRLQSSAAHREPIRLPGTGYFAFSPHDGTLVAVEKGHGARGESVTLLRRGEDYAVQEEITALGSDVLDVCFSAGGNRLAALGRQGLRIWDWENQRLLGSIPLAEPHSWHLIGFSKGESELLLVDSSLTISSWAVGRSQLGERWSALAGRKPPVYFGIQTVAYHPGTGLLVLCGDGVALVWDVRLRALRGMLRKHQYAPVYPAVSPDGRLICTAGDDGNAFLWDAESLELVKQLQTPSGALQAAAVFSPDGRRIAAGIGPLFGFGIFDVETGRELLLERSPTRMVARLRWSPDGRDLVAGDGQEAVIWRTPPRAKSDATPLGPQSKLQ